MKEKLSRECFFVGELKAVFESLLHSLWSIRTFRILNRDIRI